MGERTHCEICGHALDKRGICGPCFADEYQWSRGNRWRYTRQFKRYCIKYPEKVREDGCIDMSDPRWRQFLAVAEENPDE